MENQLILLTQSFPYGTGEPFLETEIKYLSETFSRIIIVTQNISSEDCREIPENCEVFREPFSISKFSKLSAVFSLFQMDARNEWKIARKNYGLSIKQVAKTMLVSNYRANKVADYLSRFLKGGSGKGTICYSYWSDDAAIGLAKLKSRKYDVKCISRVHGWDLYFEASAVNYLPFRQLLGEKLDRICSISNKGIDYCSERWGIERKKLVLARLGVEEQSHDTKDNAKPLVVSCSNIIPLKRVHLIIEALAGIKDDFHWFHFGSGSDMVEIQDLAARLLPSDRYTFMGQVANAQLMAWYKENNPNMFINVSSTEGIPVSIMEAFSFSVPAIATNVGGTAELVNETNGILLDSEASVDQITRALQETLFTEKDQLKVLQQGAYDTWKQHFSAPTNYSKFAKEMSELLS